MDMQVGNGRIGSDMMVDDGYEGTPRDDDSLCAVGAILLVC